MSSFDLSQTRLSVYDLALSQTIRTVPATGSSFLYVVSGTARIESEGEPVTLQADEWHFPDGPFRISGHGEAWFYEFARADAPFIEEAGFSLVMSRTLPQGSADDYILRADRVESPQGGQTPRHGHRGPGIRRLLSGRIHAFVGGNADRVETGHAWFENGKDWVVGRNAHDGISAFVRVMILPAELAGGVSSFIAASAEEAAKPRSATYQLYGERSARL